MLDAVARTRPSAPRRTASAKAALRSTIALTCSRPVWANTSAVRALGGVYRTVLERSLEFGSAATVFSATASHNTARHSRSRRVMVTTQGADSNP